MVARVASALPRGTSGAPVRSNFVTDSYERSEEIVKILKTGYVALATAAVAGAIGLAACGGTGEVTPAPDTPVPVEPDSGIGDTPIPVEPDGGTGASGGTMLAGDVLEAADFVGMTLDVAGSWAEENGRQWRVGRQDGEELALTEDFVPGRVTFTVEDGVVTAATIEAEQGQ